MQEHLIVDGNNALHAIDELAQEMSRDRNQARESLLRMLEPLPAGEGIRLTVVFDGRGVRPDLSSHGGMEDYTVIYSSSSEGADGIIERMLMASKAPGNIVVATNDGLIRNCAYQNGAAAMRVEELIKRLDSSIDQTSRRVRSRSRNKDGNSPHFENRLPLEDLEP